MMKPPLFLALIISLFHLSSCKKDEPQAPDYSTGNSVSFEVNGTAKNLTYKVPASDPFFNAYLFEDQIIQIQRLVSQGSPEGVNFTFDRIKLDQLNLPATFGYSNDSNSISLSFFYYDENNVSYGQNILDPDDFQLELSSKTNDVLEGSFSGRLYSVDGDTLSIENGVFEVWVKRY